MDASAKGPMDDKASLLEEIDHSGQQWPLLIKYGGGGFAMLAAGIGQDLVNGADLKSFRAQSCLGRKDHG